MKKIAVFTGARSEYGLLKPLILELMKTDFKFELIVSGGHLDKSQGYTINEIIKDGIPITAQIDSTVEEIGFHAINTSNAKLQIGISEYLQKNKPDLLVVLGDRSELISVVSSCLFASIPVAHISGGEVTEGATDNQVRHAVTKMAHIHFPATEIYKQNILRMGEEEWRICVSGEPGLDDVLSTILPSKEEFYERFSIPKDKELVIATFHSETIGQTINKQFLNELIKSLEINFNCHFLFTAANLDVGGEEINQTLIELSQNHENCSYVASLGKVNYYAAQKYAIAMLGNSSSGIVEAMSFYLPVVNVGQRQEGRLRNLNCIDVPVNVTEIVEALKKATNPDFKNNLENKPNIYGDGNGSKRIVAFLQSIKWNQLIHKKSTF